MRHGVVRIAGGFSFIEEPGVDEPAEFDITQHPGIVKGSRVTFDRDPTNFKIAINVALESNFVVADLAASVAAKHGLSLTKTTEILGTVLDEIGDASASGRPVSVRGLGSFKVKHRRGRQGRNPSSGEPMTIPPGKKLTFTPAKSVRDRLKP